MSRIRDFIRQEPVIVRAVLGLIVAVAASAGLDLDPELLAGIVAAVFGVTVAAQRQAVSPTKPPPSEGVTGVVPPRGEFAPGTGRTSPAD